MEEGEAERVKRSVGNLLSNARGVRQFDENSDDLKLSDEGNSWEQPSSR